MSTVPAAACAYTARRGSPGAAGVPAVAVTDWITVVVRELDDNAPVTIPSPSPTAPPATTKPTAIGAFEILPNGSSTWSCRSTNAESTSQALIARSVLADVCDPRACYPHDVARI